MRILFVTLPDSIHAARWTNQLVRERWDIHLFPAYEAPLHHQFQSITVHRVVRERCSNAHQSVQQTGLKLFINRGASRINSKLENISLFSRSARLARCIRKLKPDVIHVLEMQRAGYLFLSSAKLLTEYPLPPIVYSSWGSDLYHFGSQPEHQSRITEFLALCDYYISDTSRDLALAREYGFKGENLGVYPGGGGYDIEYLEQFRQSPISTRRLIMLKGYHGEDYGGRALVAIEAMRLCASALKDYEVVIFSAGKEVCRAAENLRLNAGIRTRIVPPSPHETIVQLMGNARISIGVGVTDGTPNAMLEAMVMGALPIQADTASTSEWITDGINGLLVAPENPESVAAAIKRAACDDKLIESAGKINQQLTRNRISSSVVLPEVINIYKKISGDCPARKTEKVA